MRLIVSTIYREAETEGAILIGKWCKTKHWKRGEAILDVEENINEYHDFNEQNLIYDRVLSQLTQDLNKYHSENFSQREWEILVGPWLRMFIGRVHRRYRELCIAKAEKAPLFLLIQKPNWKQFVPDDINQFRKFYNSSNWIEYIYDEINNNFGIFRTDYNYICSSGVQAVKNRHQNISTILKQSLKLFLSKLLNLTNKKRGSLFLACSKFSLKDKLYFSIKLKECLFGFAPLFTDFSSNTSLDISFRKRDKKINFYGELESFLLKISYKNIPKAYLEEFKKVDIFVKKSYPKNTRRIVTSINQFENEAFKLFCARMVSRGSKFDIIQHGGSYGVAKWNYAEDHDIRVSDKFFSSGWVSSEKKNIFPMPSPFLNVRANIVPNKDGQVLVPINLHTRFKSGLHSILPKFKDYYKYLEDQKQIHELVLPEIKKQLDIRVKSISDDKYHMFDPKFSEQIRSGNKSTFLNHLEQSRLLLCLNNSTTILEAMTHNFPTLLYLDRNGWPLRNEVSDVFSELERAGILFDNVNNTADTLNNIFFDVDEWWNNPKRQFAVNLFRDQLLFRSDDCLGLWLNEFSSR
jgi:putative transferase (TIGR04331 family)